MGVCVSPRDARNAAKEEEKKKTKMSTCEFFSFKKTISQEKI
jgi:hypothetical protein